LCEENNCSLLLKKIQKCTRWFEGQHSKKLKDLKIESSGLQSAGAEK
jgi:hypothetical protein